MNRWTIVPALALALVLAMAPQALRAEQTSRPDDTAMEQNCHGVTTGEVADLPPEAPWVSLALSFGAQIGLEDYQRQQLEGLRTEYGDAAARQREQIDAAERELATRLSDPVPDMQAARTVLDRLGVLRTELRLTRIETLLDARAVLSPDQRRSLAQAVAEAHAAEHGHRTRGRGEARSAAQSQVM